MSNETVYLSYVQEDTAVVARLKADLVAAGATVVDRALAVTPGLRRKPALETAINGASRFILCLSSREALPPEFTKDEVEIAIQKLQRLSTTDPWFILVRLTRCDIPPLAINDTETIAGLDAIDLYADWTSGVRHLAASLPIVTFGQSAMPSSLEINCESLETGQLIGSGTQTKVNAKKGIRVNETTSLGGQK